jgi:formate dehydrogenase
VGAVVPRRSISHQRSGFHPDVESLVRAVDVVSIHSPLYEDTRRMFNERLLATMRPGSYIVNTARAEETVPETIADALKSGRLLGYAGDVWYPQPPPPDHPWWTMPNNAMTPHVSGTTLSAQARYSAGTREILESWFAGTPIRPEYLIVEGGKLAGTGALSYQK